jgi:hypothetical protein
MSGDSRCSSPGCDKPVTHYGVGLGVPGKRPWCCLHASIIDEVKDAHIEHLKLELLKKDLFIDTVLFQVIKKLGIEPIP